MKYLIPIVLSLCLLTIGNAQEREDENCQCKNCRKAEIDKRIKDRAAEEARRRRERIHNRKLPPRIIINFNLPLADRNGRVISYNYHFERWRIGYPRYRRLYRAIYDTRPSYRNYRDRARRQREVDNRRDIWYDGLRTRTDRPRHRR